MPGVDDCLSARSAECVDDKYNTAYGANTDGDTDCDDNDTATNTEADADCDDHSNPKTIASAITSADTKANASANP